LSDARGLLAAGRARLWYAPPFSGLGAGARIGAATDRACVENPAPAARGAGLRPPHVGTSPNPLARFAGCGGRREAVIVRHVGGITGTGEERA